MAKDKSKSNFSEEIIKPVRSDELPEEFTRFDKPLGVEQHVFNIIITGVLAHVSIFYFAFYLIPFGIVSKWILIPGGIYGYLTGLGTTVGSHRYWTHKTFKANKPLQVLLMLMQTAGLQFPIFKWCRDHRVHHKYMDTNSDPHSAARGFWFSHITWLFLPKHPDFKNSLETIDISDLARDPIVRFQSKHYWKLIIIFYFMLPMLIFHLLFPELTLLQLFVINFTRHGMSLHFTFLVNSVAHKWGNKPYDKSITPTENTLVSILAVGEGWHNYHHTFPWDYKAAELGYRYNLSTLFIHFFAWIGWAWDMKTVSHKLLVDRINRTGDGSHQFYKKNDDNTINTRECANDKPVPSCWGWGDKELTKEDIEITETLFPATYRRG